MEVLPISAHYHRFLHIETKQSQSQAQRQNTHFLQRNGSSPFLSHDNAHVECDTPSLIINITTSQILAIQVNQYYLRTAKAFSVGWSLTTHWASWSASVSCGGNEEREAPSMVSPRVAPARPGHLAHPLQRHTGVIYRVKSKLLFRC